MRKKKREPLYHTGAFGHTKNNHWSCCQKKDRKSEGCEIRIDYESGRLDVTTFIDRHYSIRSKAGELQTYTVY